MQHGLERRVKGDVRSGRDRDYEDPWPPPIRTPPGADAANASVTRIAARAMASWLAIGSATGPRPVPVERSHHRRGAFHGSVAGVAGRARLP